MAWGKGDSVGVYLELSTDRLRPRDSLALKFSGCPSLYHCTEGGGTPCAVQSVST